MRRPGPAAVALFMVGAIALVLASATWLRTLAALVLVASVAVGAIAIATPAFLEGNKGED